MLIGFTASETRSAPTLTSADFIGYQCSDDKYAAEEKVVIEDEIAKTVTERRMEIEQRLTGGEPVVIVEKKLPPQESRREDSADAPPCEPIEPTEVSFEHKRMSFERGVSIEQVLHEDVPVKEPKSVAAAAASLDEKKMPSIEEQPAADVDATTLTFHEKRLSFEQGIPVREIIQKKTEETAVPADETHRGKQPSTDETEKSIVDREITAVVVPSSDVIVTSIAGKWNDLITVGNEYEQFY